MKAKTITITTLSVFILGFIVGHYVFPKQEMDGLHGQNLSLVNSFKIRDNDDLTELYLLCVYQENDWEVQPSFSYEIAGGQKWFHAPMDNVFVTPEFILLKSSASSFDSTVALTTKEHPKELLMIYDPNIDDPGKDESCNNGSIANASVVKRMLYKFCQKMNDYSYYMKSEDGVVIIDERTKLPILKPKETELPLPVKEATETS